MSFCLCTFDEEPLGCEACSPVEFNDGSCWGCKYRAPVDGEHFCHIHGREIPYDQLHIGCNHADY